MMYGSKLGKTLRSFVYILRFGRSAYVVGWKSGGLDGRKSHEGPRGTKRSIWMATAKFPDFPSYSRMNRPTSVS